MTCTWTGLCVAIPTFKRNESLSDVLVSIEAQTVRPSLVLVIDNNPGGEAHQTVETYAATSAMQIEYLALGKNTGPAGAFAAALETVANHQEKPEWMMCRGDDNPFPSTDIIAGIKALRDETETEKPAGLGIYGKFHYTQHRKEVTSERWAKVDFIPGGGLPTYHVWSLRDANLNFDASLFFGFEELDLGLQINQAGLELLARRQEQKSYVIAPRRTAPWRTYFGQRNRTIVARKFDTPRARAGYVAKALYGAARQLFIAKSPAHAKACLLGVLDGLWGGEPRKSYIPNANSV